MDPNEYGTVAHPLFLYSAGTRLNLSRRSLGLLAVAFVVNAGVKVRKNLDSSLIAHSFRHWACPLQPRPLQEKCGVEDVLDVSIGRSWEES